jgi:hypothetical protein
VICNGGQSNKSKIQGGGFYEKAFEKDDEEAFREALKENFEEDIEKTF